MKTLSGLEANSSSELFPIKVAAGKKALGDHENAAQMAQEWCVQVPLPLTFQILNCKRGAEAYVWAATMMDMPEEFQVLVSD